MCPSLVFVSVNVAHYPHWRNEIQLHTWNLDPSSLFTWTQCVQFLIITSEFEAARNMCFFHTCCLLNSLPPHHHHQNWDFTIFALIAFWWAFSENSEYSVFAERGNILIDALQSENRYRVPKGTKFYRVQVQPLQKDSSLVRSQHHHRHHHLHSQQSMTQSQQQLVCSQQEDSSAVVMADEKSKCWVNRGTYFFIINHIRG